jgi:hypothetical protein
MRSIALFVVCVAALSGCLTPAKPVRIISPALLPPPVAPFDDEPVSLLTSRRFIPGEVAIVRVCVAPDRTIASTSLVESSGDARFDSMALDWAQSVRLRSVPKNAMPTAPCGEVRVEIRAPSEPKMLSGPATSLG